MADDDDELMDETEEDYGSDDAGEPAEEALSEDGASAPWGPTMVVNGITFATSLFWQPLADQEDPMAEIKETAETLMAGADLYCMRPGSAAQYGIGNTQDGHRPGLPSAAAALAEKFSDRSSSVAVFQVEEGWWFIAIRNDLILSEEDVLYLNEEDAKRSFYAMMAVPDWGRKIAPAEWELEGAEEVDLATILKDGSGAKLQRIGGKNQKTLIIAGVAGLLVLILGYKLVSSFFAPSAPKIVRPIPIKPIFVEEEPAPVVEVPKPWESIIIPAELLHYCYDGVQKIRAMVIPGWSLQSVSCSPDGISAIWNFTWGHLGWVKRAFEEYGGGKGIDYIISDAGTSVVATLPAEKLKTYSTTPRHMIFEAKEELTQIFQSLKQDISFNEVRSQRVAVDGGATGLDGGSTMQIEEFPRLQFSFSSELHPEQWLSLFNSFAALELTNFTYDPVNNIWKYEGQIYEPRKY